jgi:hypothetical protein
MEKKCQEGRNYDVDKQEDSESGDEIQPLASQENGVDGVTFQRMNAKNLLYQQLTNNYFDAITAGNNGVKDVVIKILSSIGEDTYHRRNMLCVCNSDE